LQRTRGVSGALHLTPALLLLWAATAWAQFTCVPALGTAPPGTNYACTTTLDTTKYPDGLHTLTVIVTDAVGNTATSSVTVTFDNTPPVLSVTSPTPNQRIRGSFTVSGFATDATSNVASIAVTVDGLALRMSMTPGSISSWITDPVTPAPRQWIPIVVTATDSLGNATRTQFQVRTR
jgi:hypothetical protein